MTNITIGSDPEFVIMCGDKIENALEIFTRLQEPDYCCECPHPDEEAIEWVYESEQEEHIKNALIGIIKNNIYDLIDMYPIPATDAIIEINNNDLGKLENEHIKELVQGYYYKLYNKRLSYDEIVEKIYEENKIQLIRESLYEEPIYIHLLYELLTPEKQKEYKLTTIIDNIINFYKNTGTIRTERIWNVYRPTNFPNLNDLPDEIQENIREEIIVHYENDCSVCDMQENYFCSTELGCDGQSILGEMRPKYGNNPLEHFNQILKLMEELNDMLAPEIICYGSDQLQVKAGGYIEGEYQNYQLGGHIHIGFDEIQKESPGKAIYIQRNIKYQLAIYVGIPLTLIEKTKELTRHSHYGSFAAARYGKRYYGTEFRMPSSWLASPQITIGALSLAYVVAHDYITVMISNNDKYRNKEFFDDVQSYTGLYNDYIDLTNADLLEKIPEIYSEIQQMELYPEYKEYIDYIFNMIEKNKTWESDTNILPRWAELW